jgi:hypothetical protein
VIWDTHHLPPLIPRVGREPRSGRLILLDESLSLTEHTPPTHPKSLCDLRRAPLERVLVDPSLRPATERPQAKLPRVFARFATGPSH